MIAVFWIDWYAYHLARLRALARHRALEGNVMGVEFVGGCGVHQGLNFRADEDRSDLPLTTLLPGRDWESAGQLRIARAVWRKLNAIRPWAVLVPGYYTAPALAAAMWARLHTRRSILMTETTRADHRRVWWKEIPKRWLLRRLFDFAVCGGEPHARYLKSLGFSEARIGRCYDVVDNEFYARQSRAARRHPEGRSRLQLPERFFLYVGRLAPEKNVNGLIDAFARYRAGGGRWSLVIVGDGPERERLEKQRADLSLEHLIQFAGMKKTTEIAAYYAFASCFVLPSVREPWGLVVNEAMAAGLPVLVANRCGCAEDLVQHGENGFVFDPATPGDLESSLCAIAERPDLLRMAARSRRRIRKYSLDRWADEVARLAGVSGPRPVR